MVDDRAASDLGSASLVPAVITNNSSGSTQREMALAPKVVSEYATIRKPAILVNTTAFIAGNPQGQAHLLRFCAVARHFYE
jgi:hypothetical protein